MAIRPNDIETADADVRRRCLSKNAYSKRIALKVARRARKRTGEDIRAYGCAHCDLHHVGHTPGSKGGPVHA